MSQMSVVGKPRVLVGVENEYWRLRRGKIAALFNGLFGRTPKKNMELFRAMAEYMYDEPRGLETLQEDLLKLRREALVKDYRVNKGKSYLSPSGTPLLAPRGGFLISEGRHYLDLVKNWGLGANLWTVCGTHVHVSTTDPAWNDLNRIWASERVQQWQHIAGALSWASPFIGRRYTGRQSWRMTIALGLPSRFFLPVVNSVRGWFRFIDQHNQRLGVEGYSWTHPLVKPHVFPASPKEKNTGENRYADIGLTPDDDELTVYVAVGLQLTALREVKERGPVGRRQNQEQRLHEAMHKSAITGLRGKLLNPLNDEVVDAEDAVEVMFDYMKEVLVELGVYERAVFLKSKALDRTGAERIIDAYKSVNAYRRDRIGEHAASNPENVLDVNHSEQMLPEEALAIHRWLAYESVVPSRHTRLELSTPEMTREFRQIAGQMREEFAQDLEAVHYLDPPQIGLARSA